MYEYKFVKIELKAGFARMKPLEDYHEVIEKYSQEGWRFIQLFAPLIIGNGCADFYELIFERTCN